MKGKETVLFSHLHSQLPSDPAQVLLQKTSVLQAWLSDSVLSLQHPMPPGPMTLLRNAPRSCWFPRFHSVHNPEHHQHIRQGMLMPKVLVIWLWNLPWARGLIQRGASPVGSQWGNHSCRLHASEYENFSLDLWDTRQEGDAGWRHDTILLP